MLVKHMCDLTACTHTGNSSQAHTPPTQSDSEIFFFFPDLRGWILPFCPTSAQIIFLSEIMLNSLMFITVKGSIDIKRRRNKVNFVGCCFMFLSCVSLWFAFASFFMSKQVLKWFVLYFPTSNVTSCLSCEKNCNWRHRKQLKCHKYVFTCRMKQYHPHSSFCYSFI